MELYQLKAFITVANDKNLTKAAESLFITQPALSSQIKALEDELGVKLFKRNAKGMILTEAGKNLINEAESILKKADNFKHLANSFKDEISGTLNIGLNTNAEILKIDSFCRKIEETYPKIKINLIQSITPEIIKNLKNAKLDIGFIFGKNNDLQLKKIKLGLLEMCIVGPKEFESNADNLELHSLSVFPWILTNEECPFTDIFNELFSKYHFHPEKYIIVNQESIINTLVKNGQGFSLMLKSDALECLRSNEIFILPEQILNIELSLAYAVDQENNSSLNLAVGCIKECWKTF